MIICNQNAKNTIALTLSESQYDVSITGSTTGYTLTLVYDATNQSYSGITITNQSTGTTLERFDKFDLYLTGSTSVNYSTGRVYLPNSGQYTYYVYYNADAQTELIEQGYLRVDGSPIITTTVYTKTNTFVTYKK